MLVVPLDAGAVQLLLFIIIVGVFDLTDLAAHVAELLEGHGGSHLGEPGLEALAVDPFHGARAFAGGDEAFLGLLHADAAGLGGWGLGRLGGDVDGDEGELVAVGEVGGGLGLGGVFHMEDGIEFIIMGWGLG